MSFFLHRLNILQQNPQYDGAPYLNHGAFTISLLMAVLIVANMHSLYYTYLLTLSTRCVLDKETKIPNPNNELFLDNLTSEIHIGTESEMKKKYNTFTYRSSWITVLQNMYYLSKSFKEDQHCCLFKTRKYLVILLLVIFSVMLSDIFFHSRLKHLVHIHCSVGALSSKRVSNTLAQYATPHTYMNK